MNSRRPGKTRRFIFTASFLILLLLSACAGAPALMTLTATANFQVTYAPERTAAPSLITSATKRVQSTTPAPRPSPSPTPAFQVCSPLQGIPIDQIAAAVTNPYHPPPPGSDDPHAGADISDLIPGSQIARPGMPIQAVLSGQVAMAQTGRFPFGSAILIETPLDQLPQVWVEGLNLPAPLTTPHPGQP